MPSFGHANKQPSVRTQKSTWVVLRDGMPKMDGVRFSLLRRLTDHIWAPLLLGAVLWTFNTASESSAVRDYSLDRAEREVHRQCWTRVVELAPGAETLARRTPQDVCGCAVAGARTWTQAERDALGGLLGDAVHARRLWIAPRAWDGARMRPVIQKKTSLDAARANALLEGALSGCDQIRQP